MCLLVVLHRVTDGAPLVVAANREEFYSRGGEPPRPLGGVPAAGGVDPTHGGTWLGVNTHGVVVAVTNRRKSNPPGAPRSRGLLARDLLASGSAEEAADQAAAALGTGAYAGCNFLCADGQECLVLHASDSLQRRRLPPGLHVLANRDVNDPADRRVRQATDWLASRPLRTSAEALATLPLLCASPEVCFRLADRGTVSSSLLALPARLEEGTYLHAQGPPDVTPYADVSHLLRKLRG